MPTAEATAALAQALGLAAERIVASQLLCNGPQHFGLLVDTADTVMQLRPDFAALAQVLRALGVSGAGLASVQGNANALAGATMVGDSPQMQLRFFFLGNDGVCEDPVTGSFNASMAQWLIAQDLAPPQYVSAQGACVGHQGRVSITRDAAGQVWVGGDTVCRIEGQVLL